MTEYEEKRPSFEEDMARLEGYIEKLESGELDLEDSLTLFEKGVRLTRELGGRLDRAEQKLELLLRDENGNMTARPLDMDTDEDA